MKKFKLLLAPLSCVAAVAALAGCGNVPGDDEVRQALKGRLVSFSETLSPGMKFNDKDSKELDGGRSQRPSATPFL